MAQLLFYREFYPEASLGPPVPAQPWLLGPARGQKSLAGYSPWDREETNTTIPNLEVGNEAQRG